MKPLLFIATLAIGLSLFSIRANAEAAPILVCYPGGPVSQEDANPAMSAMLRVVERVGGWNENTFTSFFSANIDECRTLLSTKKPDYAILSLGLFLEQRTAQTLTPLVQPHIKGATTERYHLMSRQGAFHSLDELKGKTVGGAVFNEPEFMRKIVFSGKIDPAKFFDVKPSRQVLRALRSLDKGELDAVILNGQQFSALGSLQLKTPVEAVFTSADIPLMGMTANSKTTTAEDRARLANALEGMCDDQEGKKLCDMFGVEAFVPANASAIEPMIKLWNLGK